MCLTSSDSVQNYFNPGGSDPSQKVDASNPSLALSNVEITKNGNWLVCKFQRLKKYSVLNTKYFDLNNQYYVLAAYGSTDNSG
jgi:hypothetical protein